MTPKTKDERHAAKPELDMRHSESHTSSTSQSAGSMHRDDCLTSGATGPATPLRSSDRQGENGQSSHCYLSSDWIPAHFTDDEASTAKRRQKARALLKSDFSWKRCAHLYDGSDIVCHLQVTAYPQGLAFRPLARKEWLDSADHEPLLTWVLLKCTEAVVKARITFDVRKLLCLGSEGLFFFAPPLRRCKALTSALPLVLGDDVLTPWGPMPKVLAETKSRPFGFNYAKSVAMEAHASLPDGPPSMKQRKPHECQFPVDFEGLICAPTNTSYAKALDVMQAAPDSMAKHPLTWGEYDDGTLYVARHPRGLVAVLALPTRLSKQPALTSLWSQAKALLLRELSLAGIKQKDPQMIAIGDILVLPFDSAAAKVTRSRRPGTASTPADTKQVEVN